MESARKPRGKIMQCLEKGELVWHLYKVLGSFLKVLVIENLKNHLPLLSQTVVTAVAEVLLTSPP